MRACILAGGFGTRLSEETERIPKPMVEIGHRPMLWHVMKTLSAGGIDDFYIAGGYRQVMVKDWALGLPHSSGDLRVDLQAGSHERFGTAPEPWTITVADTGLDTQTGGRVRRMRPYLQDEPFLLTYGDGVGDVDIEDLVRHHRHGGYAATITAVSPPARFGSLVLDGGRVADFSEKSPTSEALINGGYMVLEPEVFDYIDRDECVLESDVLPQLAREGKLGAHVHKGFWMAMDTLRDKRALNALWDTGERPWLSIG